jgi:ferric-dicitrate binding protein FerR (iron transport regulator)
MVPSDFDSTSVTDPYDWDALARYVSGESTPDEERAVRSWLDERPERARLIAALQQSIEGFAADASDVDVGTTFTVRDDDGGRVRVAVTSGSVRLTGAAHSDSGVVLAAGDVATLGDASVAAVGRGAVREDETAFTRGRLVFRDAPLADVVVELRRWYGVELRVGDSAAARRRLTATFEGETPEQAMAIIGAALGARIERRGDTVFVR